jgi:aryl-alcohol dehydrogenase-like predicted oxidoreductase
MNYRDFGKTGVKVSEIGFGSWAIGGNQHGNSYGKTDDKVSLYAIHKAIDLGCNFFDTADVYGWGHSEELLAKALKNKRDRLIVATKVGSDFYQGMGFQTFTPKYIRFALEKSLERLKTDYIDVYQLHNPPLRLLNREATYEVLRSLKQEGRIRAWGVSIFDPTEGLTALKVAQPDSLQVAYNIFHSRPAEVLFPLAYEAGCAIIAREPLANGFLTGKFEENAQFERGDIRHEWRQDYIRARAIAAKKLLFLEKPGLRTITQASLKYVLTNKAVSAVIPGIKTPEQAEENLLSSDQAPLTAEELSKLKELQSNNFGL